MKPFPKNSLPTSIELSDAFLHASTRSGHSTREAYLAREAMLGILRLARSEHMLEIRRSVDKLIPESLRPQPAKRSKSKRPRRNQPGPQQFVFGREN